MKIALGTDHAGYPYKQALQEYLLVQGYEVQDFGAEDLDPLDDFPDYAQIVAREVVRGGVDLGILLCGSGVGMSIAANKVVGTRAALIYSEQTAREARIHNDANILCFGTREGQSQADIQHFIDIFMGEEFLGGKYERRNEKIRVIESHK